MDYQIEALTSWPAASAFFVLLCAAGAAALPRQWLELPGPWPFVLSIVAGWHLAALATFIAGETGLINPIGLLTSVILPLSLLSILALCRHRLTCLISWRSSFYQIAAAGSKYKALLALSLFTTVTLALISSAPPSKHDDLHYHLTVGQRALQEGFVRPYATPYLQTAPHMVFENIVVNLLALAPPESVGIFGLLIAISFVLASTEWVCRASPKRAAVYLCVVLIGFSNSVWWVSASSTSAAALFACFLGLWLLEERRLRESCHLSSAHSTAICTLIAAALVTTKLPFLAPAGIAVTLCILGQGIAWSGLILNCAVAALLAVTTFGPWCWRSFVATGNPLGIALFLGNGIYDTQHMRYEQDFMRSANQYTWTKLLHPASDPKIVPLNAMSPLFGLAGWLKETATLQAENLLLPLFSFGFGLTVLWQQRRLELIAWVLGSSYLLGILVHHDLRYYSVAVYFLLCVGVTYFPKEYLPKFLQLRAAEITALASIPSLAAIAYYSTIFLPVVLGLEGKEQYLEKRTGCYAVWQWLNTNTPKESRICVNYSSLPRLFYLHRFALAPEYVTKAERAENFSISAYMRRNRLTWLVSASALTQNEAAAFTLVKRFENVTVEGWRTPGRAPEQGNIFIYRITQH